MKSCISRWQSGGIADLWAEAKITGEKSDNLRKVPKGSNNQQVHNAKRAKRAAEAGQYKKAIQALTSEGLAPTNDKILNEMMDKHPQSPLPHTPDSPPPSPPSINEAGVVQALRSFPSDTAPGPSLLRANHLKEAIFCPSSDHGNRALQAITKTVNLMCAGLAPPQVVPHLCGATLLAVKKKGGGHRPIAVGEVLRRLTSKCLSRAVQNEALRNLTPLQLGVGVRVGCEAIVHAVSQTLEDEGLSLDSCHVLLLDFSNAFNSIDRSHMFSEVRARIPSLSSWVESCYSSQPILHFGKHTILSRCGVQQGDRLGPLCFALTLHSIVERLKRDVPNLLIDAWYLDDGTLCGTAEDLAKALAIIEEDGPPRGLRLNGSKSLHYIPKDADGSHNPLPPEIPITRSVFPS